MQSSSPANHVFVDFENMKTIDLSIFSGKNMTFHLFIGPENKRLDIELVEKLLEQSQTVRLIRSPKSGKNALDFILAYHLGQTALMEPKGYFHLVSKDAGFDSLVGYLKIKQIKTKRHESWSSVKLALSPAVAPASLPANSLSDDAKMILERLRRAPKSQPKKESTLLSSAKSYLGSKVTQEQVKCAIEALKKAGYLLVDEKNKITYKI